MGRQIMVRRCPNGHINSDSIKACTKCQEPIASDAPKEPFVPPADSRPAWRRIVPLVVVLVAVGGYLAMSLTGTSLSELLNPPLEVTVRVDQCQFNGGTVRAGGFVTNDGDRTVTVRVNLLVSGRYVGTDIVRDIGPGQRKSWETFDTTTPGSCSAEVEGT